MQKIKIPLAVQIIGWYLLVAGILGILSSPFIFFSTAMREVLKATQQSPEFLAITGILSSVIAIICGHALLKRKHWSRIAYAAYMVGTIIFSFWMYGFKLWLYTLLPLLITIVSVVFLFMPNVNRYFGDDPEFTSEDNTGTAAAAKIARPLWRKILANLALVFAGFWLYMSFFVVNGILDSKRKPDLGGLTTFVGPTLLLFLLGIWLWNWSRWRKLVGIVDTAVGAFLLLIGGVMFQFDASMLPKGRQTTDYAAMKILGLRGLLTGSVILIVGIALIIWQRRRDRSQSSH